jgi:hypothetical protein
MEAEIASLTAKIAATKLEVARLNGELEANPPIALAGHSAQTAAFADALKQREAEIVFRFRTICQRYADAGCGNKYFPLLMCLLFEVSASPQQTLGLFEAAKLDAATSRNPS